MWQMEKVKQSRKGSKTYTYWMASWREGGKTRNVHLGSARKMDGEAARRKARERKAEALGMRRSYTKFKSMAALSESAVSLAAAFSGKILKPPLALSVDEMKRLSFSDAYKILIFL